MEHKTLAEIERAGEATPAVALSRAERLDRWARALDRLEKATLGSIWRTEHIASADLPRVRADNSPLSVAFEDPVLRVAGLSDDSYGEAKRFFELSDHELHWIVCYCHVGNTLSAKEAAWRVRAVAATRLPETPIRGFMRRFLYA